MWIVMTSSAKMPSSCMGRYRNVALVKVTQQYAAWGLRPAMIADRAKGVIRVVHMGHHNVGKTDKCGYARALAAAEARALALNNADPIEESALIVTWGGSA